MKTPFAVFALSMVLGASLPAIADPAPQPLSIAIAGDGARATQLPQYDPAAPIAVRVSAPAGAPVDAVTVVAAGPTGESLRTPLQRTPDGTFDGSLALQAPGAWQLRLNSQSGKSAIDSSPVTVNVVAPPPSNAWLVGLGVGAAVFILVGGGGFLILRRTVAANIEQAPARAA